MFKLNGTLIPGQNAVITEIKSFLKNLLEHTTFTIYSSSLMDKSSGI